MAEMKPHISIKGEEIFEIGHYPITNSIITSALVLVFFIALASLYYQQTKNKKKGLLVRLILLIL